MSCEISLLAIGEVMAEIRTDVDGELKIGYAGDTYNAAVYCSRMLPTQQTVSYYTCLGTDPLSERFLQHAANEKIDTSNVELDPNRNIGVYAISTDAFGERTFSYWRNDSAARRMFEHAEISKLPTAKVTYLSGITLAIMNSDARQQLIERLAELSATKSTILAFDSNYRPLLWKNKKVAQQTILRMWEIADIALPSIDDEMALFDLPTEQSVVDRFSERTWTACAIKRGARGPISVTLPPNQIPNFAPASIVVDTTAAGDSFNGAYIAAFINGDKEAQCLSKAHAIASDVVGFSGAMKPGSA